MKLNKNSWLAKYVLWFTLRNNLPKDLCSYFWTSLSTVILAPLMLLVWIPEIIISYVFSEEIYDWEDRGNKTFAFYFISGIVFTLGVLIYKWPIITISIILGLAILIFAIVKMVRYFQDRKYDNLQHDERGRVIRKPNIIVEFVKAKKKKYCPIIEWEEK